MDDKVIDKVHMLMRRPKKSLTDGTVAPRMLSQQAARQGLVVALVREMLNSSTHTTQFHHLRLDFTSIYIRLFLQTEGRRCRIGTVFLFALLHFIITPKYEEDFWGLFFLNICFRSELFFARLDYSDKNV